MPPEGSQGEDLLSAFQHKVEKSILNFNCTLLKAANASLQSSGARIGGIMDRSRMFSFQLRTMLGNRYNAQISTHSSSHGMWRKVQLTDRRLLPTVLCRLPSTNEGSSDKHSNLSHFEIVWRMFYAKHIRFEKGWQWINTCSSGALKIFIDQFFRACVDVRARF